jgi:hypothetical protein
MHLTRHRRFTVPSGCLFLSLTAVEPGDQWASIEEGGTPIAGDAHG